jgi:hypothetical protein
MVIVKLQGGLGNQMFQYAVGRHLADRLNTRLKLDLQTLLDRTPQPNLTFRDYELDIFNLRAEIATPADVARFAVPQTPAARWLRKLRSPFAGYRIIREATMAYDPRVPAAAGNLYLEGFWQSERYFSAGADAIRRDFSFKTPPGPENQRVLAQMEAGTAVSVHIRRGDYVHNERTNSYHGICSLDYYDEAVATLAKRVPDPRLFVFSDDIAWVKEAWKVPYPVVYVAHNQGRSSWEDLRLMSRCRHHVIANSSFSWWGAWLNPDPAKLVVAPKHWLNPESYWYKEYNISDKDVVPSSWLTL